MIFLTSDKINVYPSAYRGINGSQLKDPASRLNIEENIIKSITNLASSDSFIVVDNYEQNSTIECSIHGYWFKLNLTNINFEDKPYVYAQIKLEDKNPTPTVTDYKATSLSSQKTIADVNNSTVSNNFLDDDDGHFYGLQIITSDTKIEYPDLINHLYGLLILVGDGTTYKVPDSSKLKFKANVIENINNDNAGVSIHQEFDTNTLHVSDTADIGSGLVVTGDVKIKNGTYNRVDVDVDGTIKIQNTSGSNRLEISSDGKTIKKFIGNNCIYKLDEYGNTGNYDFEIPTNVWDATGDGRYVDIRISLVFNGAKFEKITHSDNTIEYAFDLAISGGKRLYATSSSGAVDSWWKGLDYQKANFAYDSSSLTITYES